MLACVALLVSLMLIEYDYAYPLFLVLSPMGSYVILDFRANSNTYYARAGFAMASIALSTGCAAAVVQSSAVLHAYVHMVKPMVTFSIQCGICQMMLVLNKSDIPRVMLCTACAVICSVLALAPLISTNSIGNRCFQGCVLPILFLFWQSLDQQRTVPLAVVCSPA